MSSEKNEGSSEVKSEDPKNQPAPLHWQAQLARHEVCNDYRHRFAVYFGPYFTYEMIEFCTDPANRGGKEYIPPKEIPSIEIFEKMNQKADAATKEFLACQAREREKEDELDRLNSELEAEQRRLLDLIYALRRIRSGNRRHHQN